MIRMFIHHAVNDYATWRAAYDAFDQERQGMGVTEHAVFQAAGDANDVTVTHDFQDLQAAQSFAESPRLKEVMSNAGVAAPPTIWFTTPA